MSDQDSSPSPNIASAGPSDRPASAGLQDELTALRSLLILTLSASLLLSVIANLYLLREMMTNRKDLAAVEIRVKPAAEQYARDQAPMIQNFINNVVAFGRSNPDFVPILQKYNLAPSPAAAPTPVSPGGVPIMPVK